MLYAKCLERIRLYFHHQLSSDYREPYNDIPVRAEILLCFFSGLSPMQTINTQIIWIILTIDNLVFISYRFTIYTVL
jgi:hypothetical protein